jgi:SlyX protein
MAATDAGLEGRIDELESRLAFQDDTIANLDQALADQQKRLSNMEKSLTFVMDRIRGEEAEFELPTEERPPPHY